MTTLRATASFTFSTWEQTPILTEPRCDLARTTMAKDFSGELTGTSRGELLMAVASEESAAYAGFERLTVTLGERSGSFVLCHVASYDAGMSLTVLPGSGTEGFVGIAGTAGIERHEDGSHTFTLDATLAD